MMKDLATKIDNDHGPIFSTHVPKTWAVALKNQRVTQETEGVGEEPKVEKNTCNEERRIIEACSIKKVNGYEAHEIEEIATKNDIQSEMAMDESMVDGHVETFLTLHLETCAIVSENRCKTQETRGDGKNQKVETNTCDEERSIIKNFLIEKINGYEAHDFEEIAMENDVKAKMVNGHEEPFPTLVLETWALTDVRPKRRKLASRKKRSILIRTTLRWKWLSVARKRWTMEMYGSLHTRSRELGINRCKTQEKDSDGEEPRVKADVCNKEFEQNMTKDGNGQASLEDPKDVITTSIEEDNGCEAHEIEEATSKDDIKEVVMDDTTKAIDQRHMEYSMLVPETWAVATESQRETQETEDADKEKIIVSVHNKNGE